MKPREWWCSIGVQGFHQSCESGLAAFLVIEKSAYDLALTEIENLKSEIQSLENRLDDVWERLNDT